MVGLGSNNNKEAYQEEIESLKNNLLLNNTKTKELRSAAS